MNDTKTTPEAGPGAPAAAPARPFTIGAIIFPNMTNLDLVGPVDVFARIREAKVHLIAPTLEPVVTDSATRVLPDMAMKDAPDLDLIFIGGGPGTTALMENEEMLSFLRAKAPRAKWITSVCTGALVLGAAGLLRGYRAATHWTAMELLPLLGAIPVYERVVIDRNRITAGGVTAGIDFGLSVVAELWGPDRAQLIQLGTEYNPQPPFNAGSPNTAPTEVVARFRQLAAATSAARLEASKRAGTRFS